MYDKCKSIINVYMFIFINITDILVIEVSNISWSCSLSSLLQFYKNDLPELIGWIPTGSLGLLKYHFNFQNPQQKVEE